MSEKRFECVFIEDDEFGGTFRRLKDNETGIMHMTCDVVDLLNFQNTQIKILKEENERLKEKLNVTALELVDEAISMGKAVEISEMNYHEFLEYRKKKGKAMELQR